MTCVQQAKNTNTVNTTLFVIALSLERILFAQKYLRNVYTIVAAGLTRTSVNTAVGVDKNTAIACTPER